MGASVRVTVTVSESEVWYENEVGHGGLGLLTARTLTFDCQKGPVRRRGCRRGTSGPRADRDLAPIKVGRAPSIYVFHWAVPARAGVLPCAYVSFEAGRPRLTRIVPI